MALNTGPSRTTGEILFSRMTIAYRIRSGWPRCDGFASDASLSVLGGESAL